METSTPMGFQNRKIGLWILRGTVLSPAKAGWTISGVSDEKVKYDAGDPVAGYLADKFVAGAGITLAEGTGADENKLKITNSDRGSTAVSSHEGTYNHSLIATALQSESDPIFSAWQSSYDHHANWDTAYGWGNHASAGYALLDGTNQPFTGLVNVQLTTKQLQLSYDANNYFSATVNSIGSVTFLGTTTTNGADMIFSLAAPAQLLFDGQTTPVDPSIYTAGKTRVSYKMYYGSNGTSGTIPASMSISNIYQLTEFYTQPYVGAMAGMTLFGSNTTCNWRSSVTYNSGKSGFPKIEGAFYSCSISADATFTQNVSGRPMNINMVGAEYSTGFYANLTVIAGTIGVSNTGMRINMVNSGFPTYDATGGNITHTGRGLWVTPSLNGRTIVAGTVVENLYGLYSDTINANTLAIGLNLSASSSTTGGTAIGIKIATPTGGTNNWAIASDGGSSYHVGNLRVGGNTAPVYPLDATGDINTSTLYRVNGTPGLGTVATPLVIVTAALTLMGAQGSQTFIGGILTAQVQAT